MLQKTQTPPAGWNSYDSYGSAINEAEALMELAAFVEKLAPHGYEYFVLDAGWFIDGGIAERRAWRLAKTPNPAHITPYGDYEYSRERFPGGLRAIADAAHKAGVKFGLHRMRGMPLVAIETLPEMREMYAPDDYCTWSNSSVGIDMDHPNAKKYYERVIEHFANDYEIDFLKLDDVTYNPKDIAAVVAGIEKVERPIVLSLSPGNTVAPCAWKDYSTASCVRITKDIWDRPDDINDSLRQWALFENCTSGNCWLDLDMIPIGGLQVNVPIGTPPEACPILGCRRQANLDTPTKQAFMVARALACSPLILGGAPSMLTDEDLALLTHPEILACNRSGIVAKQIWAHNYADIRKEEKYIGVFNQNPSERGWKFRLTPEALGFDSFPKLWNVFENCAPTINRGVLDFTLPPGGVLFLKYE